MPENNFLTSFLKRKFKTRFNKELEVDYSNAFARMQVWDCPFKTPALPRERGLPSLVIDVLSTRHGEGGVRMWGKTVDILYLYTAPM